MDISDTNEAVQSARERVGMPEHIHFSPSETVLDQFDHAIAAHGNSKAFTCLGHSISYRELELYSRQLAAYFQQHTNLKPGDRIAVQLVNTVQYPIVMFAALRAGLILVNTNPLYTEREMLHQFKDSGAKALVVLENMASKVEAIISETEIETVLVTELADMLPFFKRTLINTVVKHVKKLVPQYHLDNAVNFREALALGSKATFVRYIAKQDDIAVLQYTGGTTGVAKGAMLTHRNLVANMYQSVWLLEKIQASSKQLNMVCPLPLYHIYAFTVHCLVGLRQGVNNILIPNPRDIPCFYKNLKNLKIDVFVGLNTLFVALAKNEKFRGMDFSNLRLTLSGGMALTEDAASQWEVLTACPITEGYGLTETSPIAFANPLKYQQVGSIGLPVPDTEFKIIAEDGKVLPIGESGELCLRGPQVMKGYWQSPEETAEVMGADGWFRTGDIARVKEDGFTCIVDRAKDMILVSGFNVYPNELENVLSTHPDVLECAAVGVPDEHAGEAVKMFVVSHSKELSRDDVIQFMRKQLTSYKMPRDVEFRDDLPKSPVGKILRRELRD